MHSPEADKPGVDMPPPLYFALPLVALFVVEWFLPTALLARPGGWVAGATLVLAGIALNVAGAVTQRRAGTDFLPERPSTKVVSHGVYAWTRNPMYVGFALITGGVAFLFGSWWALGAVPIGIVLIQTQVIAREERYLTSKFGEEYVAYTKRVRRWL